jgi:hypothetical protein
MHAAKLECLQEPCEIRECLSLYVKKNSPRKLNNYMQQAFHSEKQLNGKTIEQFNTAAPDLIKQREQLSHQNHHV